MTNTIFVFGSNLAGRHGKGAAVHAKKYYGAEYGVGEGLTGRSYALPTKDENLNVRSLQEIKNSIQTFSNFARENPQYTFELTPVGCGLAGYKQAQIITLIVAVGMPSNVCLSEHWDWKLRRAYNDTID
jgi:hypothetical protein